MNSSSLPAYAKPLIALRMAGHHPLRVKVRLGRDWSEAVAYWSAVKSAPKKLVPFSSRWRKQFGDPWLAVKPDSLAAGAPDFRCVAGCAVWLFHDRAACPAEQDDFFGLVGALARQASMVYLEPKLDGELTADGLAGVFRWLHGRWPAWWCDDLEAEHERNRQGWIEDFIALEHAATA